MSQIIRSWTTCNVRGPSDFEVFAYTLDPDCVQVDSGVPTGLDVNGPLDDLYTGCAPDVGAFECLTDVCDNECP